MEFQSTLPRRERRVNVGKLHRGLNFNPRSREGSDTEQVARVEELSNFNPRSREGSDSLIRLVYPVHTISIHAPAKGATLCIFE